MREDDIRMVLSRVTSIEAPSPLSVRGTCKVEAGSGLRASFSDGGVESEVRTKQFLFNIACEILPQDVGKTNGKVIHSNFLRPRDGIGKTHAVFKKVLMPAYVEDKLSNDDEESYAYILNHSNDFTTQNTNPSLSPDFELMAVYVVFPRNYTDEAVGKIIDWETLPIDRSNPLFPKNHDVRYKECSWCRE